jgi:bifunctional non-homologous end joining protein LigD
MSSTARDTSIRTYRSKRNFAATSEPPPKPATSGTAAPIFVVQKHAAHRAGLHWDFRLEHDGVLWSWAVRKGPSLDPKQKHIAAHVEDHPLEYADFQGTIPDGEYGAGTVETWDRGTWEPAADPAAGMEKGELTFVLHGKRLNGRFHLVRMKPRPRERGDNWLLFKGNDDHARPGIDAAALEAEVPPPRPPKRKTRGQRAAPAPGAIRGKLPKTQAPQLCSPADEPPEGDRWLSEIKFDGYRLLIWLDHGKARLVTRRGLDWTDRLPAVARGAAHLDVETALIDTEMVALRPDGTSSFHDLQAALSAGKDGRLYLYIFDLLHLNGWDLRRCRLIDRKDVLRDLAGWGGMLRYSDHQIGQAAAMQQEACRRELEGTVCKRVDAPYSSGRGHDWLKLKCQQREEFVVLGWTPPAGSRNGLGSLHLGFYDQQAGLHYVGGVGTGFSGNELTQLRERLNRLAAPAPKDLLVAGDPLDPSIHWVRPELVAEVQFAGWSGAGRVRQAVYLGLREDKPAKEVVRELPDADAERGPVAPRTPARGSPATRIVTARAPKKEGRSMIGNVTLTHPERELWPGITKRELAEYWQAVAEAALPGIAGRPLAVVRCPDGIDGERFFQKHGHGMPTQIRQGEAEGQPYLAIDGVDGLVAMAQMAAIELHPWGATEADPLHPDRIVFDLDPGEGVPFEEVVKSAREVRDRLAALGLTTFCRTTGGKGLHVVAPLTPKAGWDEVKPFCRDFAETISREQPDRYLSTVKKADRKGRILVDWLRNGLGATAISSYCPRARPGATVATPLSWDEVGAKLDLGAFTLQSVPRRLQRLKKDPWAGFATTAQELPALEPKSRKRR